jgi:hypothetical protein
MPGDVVKVSVSGQHREIVPYTELRQEGVYGAYLDSRTPTSVSQVGRLDMIGLVRGNKGQA